MAYYAVIKDGFVTQIIVAIPYFAETRACPVLNADYVCPIPARDRPGIGYIRDAKTGKYYPPNYVYNPRTGVYSPPDL